MNTNYNYILYLRVVAVTLRPDETNQIGPVCMENKMVESLTHNVVIGIDSIAMGANFNTTYTASHTRDYLLEAQQNLPSGYMIQSAPLRAVL